MNASNIPADMFNAGIFARLTDRSRRIINLAQIVAVKVGQNSIDTEHLLIAIAEEGSGVACTVLYNLKILEKSRSIRIRPAPGNCQSCLCHSPNRPGRFSISQEKQQRLGAIPTSGQSISFTG